MTFDKNLSRFLLLLGLLLTKALVAGMPIHYAAPMGDEKWRMSGTPIRCEMTLMIPNFGVGYFEQKATKPPHFILRRYDSMALGKVPVQISARSPVWKPYGPSFAIAKGFVNPGRFALFLTQEPTLKVLTYLSQGYQTNFNYRSPEGFNVTVALSPIAFQKVYSKFQRCLGDLLPFTYDNVKESVFHFDVDSKELTEKNKEQLRKIARYVEADTRIEKIKVLGYTDDRGRKGYNNAVSQFRAEAVKAYLIKLGVPQEKLYVTWFGVLKPIARNDTDAGRAENRRVVVNLIKK